MQPASAQMTPFEDERGGGEFFIPDLCGPRPVLLMVVLVELLAVMFVLAGSALPHFNWDALASSSLFMQWVVLLSAAVLCGLRRSFAHLSLPLAAMASLMLVLAITAVSSYCALLLFPQLSVSAERGWWLLRNLLVAAVLAGIVLRYFYLQQQLRIREHLENQARLDALRSRIRPHFLFNTLNSIASLIATRPAAAEQAVEDLADLFRASLRDGQQATTVADELRLCELYLGIEQLRLGSRLQVDWQVDAAARRLPMPPLVLQPLVENAVYHGVSQLPAGGTVRIVVQVQAGRVCATVENPLARAATGGHRMAVTNIEQRLQALFGSAADLQVQREDGHYRVQLTYPVEVTA